MSVRDILSLGLHNQGDWYFKHYEFENTLDTGAWETVKDTNASAAVGSDAQNGTLVLSSEATTDNNGALVQSINEFFKPTADKRAALRARVKSSDADQHDMFIGFAQTAATDPEACLTASNRVGFQVNDGDASLLLKVEAADIETSVDSQSDQGDDTYVILGIKYDGSRYHFEINDSPVGSISDRAPATEMGISLFNLSGNATGTHTSTIDYVTVAVEK